MIAPTPRPARLARPAEVHGVGIHSGRPARVRLLPATEGHGRRFVRCDLPGAPEIPARVEHVVSTRMATCLACGEARMHTVEHLLAALAATQLHDLRIEVDGPELPALDGSALGWVQAIEAAGLSPCSEAPPALCVARPLEVRLGDAWARVNPAEALELTAEVDFPHPAIGRQRLSLRVSGSSFREELAWARTFGFLHEVEQLRAAGLARGGSLENAVVFDAQGPMNPEGLRAPDEVVRHKLLDLLGDLALLGRPLQARVEAHRPGHALNRRLVEALLVEASAN